MSIIWNKIVKVQPYLILFPVSVYKDIFVKWKLFTVSVYEKIFVKWKPQ